MNAFDELKLTLTRRHFLAAGSSLLGTAAIASLCGPAAAVETSSGHALPTMQLPPKAKHVIYLHMVGGPPQMDLFDYKPSLGEWFDKDLPDSVRMGQRLTTMSSGQARFPIAPPIHRFEKC